MDSDQRPQTLSLITGQILLLTTDLATFQPKCLPETESLEVAGGEHCKQWTRE